MMWKRCKRRCHFPHCHCNPCHRKIQPYKKRYQSPWHICVSWIFSAAFPLSQERITAPSKSVVDDDSVSCSCRILWYERMYARARCENSRTRSVVMTSLEKHFLTVRRKFSLPLCVSGADGGTDSSHTPKHTRSLHLQVRSDISAFDRSTFPSPLLWDTT